MPEPYEPQDALSILRQILSNDGDLVVRSHCYERMAERSADDVDVRKVLEENGIIQSGPDFDQKYKKWKYSVDGYDTENEKLRVVVNISEVNWRVVAISVVGDWKEKKK